MNLVILNEHSILKTTDKVLQKAYRLKKINRLHYLTRYEYKHFMLVYQCLVFIELTAFIVVIYFYQNSKALK